MDMEMEIDLDRLIALPDSLKLDILDLLGMKEVAVSAALYLWCKGETMDEIRCFVARVPAVLALCSGDGIALDTFSVSFCYDDCFASDVDSWLDFAAKKQVKNIYLSLKDYCYSPKPIETYELSRIMYSNSSFTELRLENCCVAPSPPPVEWRFLRRLWLEFVYLTQQAIGGIVSGCPVLETLDLDWCCGHGFDRLDIGGRSFRRLRVKFAMESLLEISAPYMRDLQITGRYCSIGRNLLLRDIPAVESAYIDFFTLDWRMMPNVVELFQDLRHVKKLELSEKCTRIVSLMATNGLQLPQSEVEDVRMHVEDDERSINGVIALLESSPHLETLQLFGRMSMLYVDVIKWGSTTRDNLTCDLIHLKTVDIKFFPESTFSVKLATMLKTRAPFAEINIKQCGTRII